MQQTEGLIRTADADHNAQVSKNVALGIAGVFLIVPWFFMDVGNAATIENRAAQARLQKLQLCMRASSAYQARLAIFQNLSPNN